MNTCLSGHADRKQEVEGDVLDASNEYQTPRKTLEALKPAPHVALVIFGSSELKASGEQNRGPNNTDVPTG